MVITIGASLKDPRRQFPGGGKCWGIGSETKYFELEGENIVYSTYLTGPPPLQLQVTIGGFKRSEIYEDISRESFVKTVIDVEPITDKGLIEEISKMFEKNRPIVYVDFYQQEGNMIRKTYDNRPKRDWFDEMYPD